MESRGGGGGGETKKTCGRDSRHLSYLTVSTDDVLNTNNNETEFPELRKCF